MAKVIRFPVERASRRGVLKSPYLPVAWLPLAMSGYFWLATADAMLTCWLFASGIPAPRGQSTSHRRAPKHRT
ncbi:hypothetical protein EQG41_16815 [Billgrantia azerbaijanica]|nr:hypothetical protein EQG41_16815 [Halomonas azerbaijanica]